MKVLVCIILLSLSGCSAYKHHQIVKEDNRIKEKLNIPEYGVSNRNSKIYDISYTWGVILGSNELKKILTK